MAIQFASYNDANMQTGKFYLVEVNKDNASNLRDINTITAPLLKAEQDIATIYQDILDLNAKNDLQDVDINGLNAYNIELKTQLDDNTARINNIENEDLRSKFLTALEIASIRKNFSNATEIEIQYGRKEVISIQVYVITSQNDDELIYTESSSTLLIQQVISLNESGVPIIKKIKIKSNQPITGYVLVL